MERTEPPRPTRPAWRRVADAFHAPRTLHWNLSGASAVATVAFLVVGTLVTRRPTTERAQPASAPVVSTAPATASAPVLVRLVVLQPGATAVLVAGDFNGWNPARTPLEQISSGAWAVTMPLRPGRYEYMFVVDGKWIADPFAAEQNDDGFGSRNAVLDVRPEGVAGA
jgi:hypothetical protein